MPAKPTTTLTVRLSAETKAKLDRLAEITERSKSFLAAKALEDYVDYELEICEGILEGIADAEAGRTVPHEQVMAEMQAIIDAAAAKTAEAGLNVAHRPLDRKGPIGTAGSNRVYSRR